MKAPPPPVELAGVPAAVDVRQPGDGTIEFRIAHLQRLRHGPEALVWLVWTAAFGVGAVGALAAERWPLAALGALLALPGVNGLYAIWRLARTFTRIRWDRESGALTVLTTGGPERAAQYGVGAGLVVRAAADGIELVSVGLTEKRLAIGVPLNATEWVIASMRAMASGWRA